MENELAGETSALYNPKLGVGGLVDIEFVVQFHQLMYGQSHPAVRARSTRESLDALAAAGVLDGRAHATLRDAYRFLRRLLNRMRIVHDRPQDHLAAEAGAEIEKLARRMGYRGTGVGEQLLADYRATTRKVRALYSETLAP
jgi:[glutamine synthetase] adenylyltransferase / [glutamine synthetase]-adenylyl-L-tyrosine phosphorylase